MSKAFLCVWVTPVAKPCEIEDEKTLFIYVLKCDGKPLVHCGKKYVAIPTKCGYAEFEIPPGCYVVGAVENPDGIPPLGNHLTHIQIVRVNCGDRVCVTLFNPSAHFCGHWFLSAVRQHLEAAGNAVPAETARAIRNALQPLEALVKALPEDELTRALKGVEEIARPKLPPKGGTKKSRTT
jgi:hypothetical protein